MKHPTPETGTAGLPTGLQPQRDVEFISLMAHDLRQPLSVILGMGTLLERTWDALSDDCKREHVAHMMRSTKWMKAIVDELMAADVEKHTPTAPPAVRFSVQELVAAAIDAIDPEHADRLTLHASPDLPLGYGDPVKQRQVIQNLLDNAIKYSDSTTPIDIWLKSRDDMLAVTVADRGLGISSQDAQRIFDKYVRVADDEHQASIEGSGLGLFVCKALVTSQGGEIGVESNTNGVGSVFTYTLPAAA